jgi:hypothetical protein
MRSLVHPLLFLGAALGLPACGPRVLKVLAASEVPPQIAPLDAQDPKLRAAIRGKRVAVRLHDKAGARKDRCNYSDFCLPKFDVLEGAIRNYVRVAELLPVNQASPEWDYILDIKVSTGAYCITIWPTIFRRDPMSDGGRKMLGEHESAEFCEHDTIDLQQFGAKYARRIQRCVVADVKDGQRRDAIVMECHGDFSGVAASTSNDTSGTSPSSTESKPKNSDEDAANCRERVLNLRDKLASLEKQKADNRVNAENCVNAGVQAKSEGGAIACAAMGGAEQVLIDAQINSAKADLNHWQARCGQ